VNVRLRIGAALGQWVLFLAGHWFWANAAHFGWGFAPSLVVVVLCGCVSWVLIGDALIASFKRRPLSGTVVACIGVDLVGAIPGLILMFSA
jgi:hypothetical protein